MAYITSGSRKRSLRSPAVSLGRSTSWQSLATYAVFIAAFTFTAAFVFGFVP